MTEPLDFTSAGRKRAAAPAAITPSPQKAQPPQTEPPPRAPQRTPVLRPSVMVAAVAMVLVVFGLLVFHHSGKKSAPNPELLGRYCQLSAEFNSIVPNTAAAGAADTSSVAASALIHAMGPTLQEMVNDAPAPVHSQAAAVVTALREAASGDLAGLRAPSFSADRQKLSAYQANTCLQGSGNNDQ